MKHYDIVVAGGGMVGACVANLLGQSGMSVLVVEPFDANQIEFAEHPGLRTSAFNRFSIELMQRTGAWQHVSQARRAPYTGLQTWEESNNPLVFDANEVELDYLGHILENNLVQKALWQQFQQHNVEVNTPNSIQSYEALTDKIIITLNDGEKVSSELLIAADGANSKVRQMAGIGVEGWQYQQHCMAITVKMKDQLPPVTWQQFHPSGPRAYLPLYGNYASLIWYDSAERISELKKLNDNKLAEQITLHFPQKLGEFELLEKGSFPLTRMHAKRYYDDRVVLIGDAAHTINPLAGQGVNLGFKDADKLAQCILKAYESAQPCWDDKTLNQYHQARYKHNLLMMSAMDGFYLGFSNDIAPIKFLRNAGLSLANNATVIKRQVLRYALG